ncbi:MAG: formate/nitrite transporter family protein [Lachnospiraceae bacterium]|nr:formate/nitrite transporter family protein [Ruminococcus sp.]MCM1275010.1 formate/nitrite transporter family protein [Lachnospiraceae bacterium]
MNATLKRTVSQLANGTIGGMMIGIGGCVSLSCDNKYIGALLFSLGLFAIVQFGFGLYTGKVGYIPLRKPVYLLECLFTLLGNALGTFIDAFLLKQTRIYAAISEKAAASVDAKLADGYLSMFVLAVFCGLLMFLAVDNARISRAENGHIEKTVGVMFCVMVFILCGFNHCIADMFYLFLTGRIADAGAYLPLVILGNSVGGMLLPLLKMLTDKPFEREK